MFSSKTNQSAVQYERQATDIIRDPLTPELNFPGLLNPSDLLFSMPWPASDLLKVQRSKTQDLLTATTNFTVAFTLLWCKHYTHIVVVGTHGSSYS